MRLRQEQVVCLLVALLVGGLVWSSSGEDGGGRRVRGARAGGSRGRPELERFAVPDVSVALPPGDGRNLEALARDVFSEPRDSRPLPPLDLVQPPLSPLAALAPPPDPAPEPARLGRFLRTPPAPVAVPIEGLFQADEEDAGGLDLLAELDASAERATLSPEERAARLESWKGLYDWIRLEGGQPIFGSIRNDDRYGLAQRLEEPVLFVEVDPQTGQERFPGQDPVPYQRSRVSELHLADTVQNRVRAFARTIGDSISPSQYAPVLAFADWCVERRLDAPDALAVAERLYRVAAAASHDDPAPRLGLARCFEAGFDFERAYAEYLDLAQAFPHRPEVLVRLAQLEARFRMFERARERLRAAERAGRTAWEVQAALGRFLLERGEPAAAVEHLELAYRYEPPAELRDERVGIRLALASAYVAVGRADEGRDLFEKALQADPESESARAGLATVDLLAGRPTATDLTAEEAGFELLLASGLSELARGEWREAETRLRLAAQADPLRAWKAWRALSWLAERTGYAEEALAWVERAHEAAPEDPWTLYQRGRLAAVRDDFELAAASFQAALDRELDFVEALVAMGALHHGRGRHDAAERYLERALSLDPEQPDVHVLRGVNALQRGDDARARAAFEAALAQEPEHPAARNGLAWCAYVEGDPEQAIRQFAELDDARRAEPETDPHRAYARAQIARITDHLEKLLWSDHFERRTLRNDWSIGGESTGPEFRLEDGHVALSGTFRQAGRVRAFRSYAASDFVAFEVELTVLEPTRARVGVFLSRERPARGGEVEVREELSLSRHREGVVQTQRVERGDPEAPWTDHTAVPWPAGQPVRLRIERRGEGSDTTGTLSIDGVPVLEDVSLRSFAASTGDVRVGVFAEGETGRGLEIQIDDTQVVYRAR